MIRNGKKGQGAGTPAHFALLGVDESPRNLPLVGILLPAMAFSMAPQHSPGRGGGGGKPQRH